VTGSASPPRRPSTPYVDFLDGYLSLLSSNATMLFAFAILGFAIERYARDEARPLVLFFGYCGIASLVGYPLGSDIAGDWAWISTHVVVPLAVPAAVGVAWFYRAGLAARADRDTAVAAIVALVLVVGAFQAGLTAATDVYRQPQAEDNELVQFAQPHDDLDPIVDELSTIAAETGGTDAVLYYGEDGETYDSNVALVNRPGTRAFWDIRPTCSDWSTTQPLNWYVAAADATVTCERSADALVDAIESDPPPMIVTAPGDSTIPTGVIRASYEAESYHLRTIGLEITVYTHESRN
jgi:Predicted membrane-bound mannosyltransferase